MNIKKLLSSSINELANSGIPTPDLDVRILLEAAIKRDNAFVFSHPDFLITNAQYSRFRRYIRRRKTGEPIAYILGYKEFFGLEFKVNKNALIPRPETEYLVEKGADFIKSRKECNVLDMGTGSGCIIISLASLANASFYATDIFSKTLLIAKKNAKLNNVTNVQFYLSDLFSNKRLPNKFDLIIANLPYVPRSAVNFSVRFEPIDAIFANDNGTAIIKKFLIEAKDKINLNGMILIEADCRNAKKIFEFAKKTYPEAVAILEKDLAGLDRYISIKK